MWQSKSDSKGHWQGLGEGFIIVDFIDDLQSCLCVCVYVVNTSRDSEWAQKEQQKKTKMKKTTPYVDTELSELLWYFLVESKHACLSVGLCVLGCRCVHLLLYSGYWADSHNHVVNKVVVAYVCVCVLCSPEMDRGTDSDLWWRAAQFLLHLLALIPVACKCDCNLHAVFMLKFMTSPGFAEQKRELKAKWSIGPRQAQFLWAPLNWCQIFRASPERIRKRRWITSE